LEFVVQSAGAAIKAAGEPQKTEVRADTTGHFYEVKWSGTDGDPSQVALNTDCLTIVHGRLAVAPKADETWFDLEKAAKDSIRSKYKVPAGSLQSAMTEETALSVMSPQIGALIPPRFEFSDDIRFFGRFAIEPSDDKTAVKISPQFVLVGDLFEPKKHFASGERDIVLTLTIHGPDASGTGDAFSVASLTLPRVKAGTYYDGADAYRLASGWFPPAPLPKSVGEHISARDQAVQDLRDLKAIRASLQRSLTDGKDSKGQALTSESRHALEIELVDADAEISRMGSLLDSDPPFRRAAPITFRATLAETQDGVKYLSDIGDFLLKQKEALAAPVFDAIDPDTRRAAIEARADNKDTLRLAAIDAVDNFRKADATTGEDRSEAAVRSARIKAEGACRKLRQEGFSDIDCLGF
tara:strand:- start:3274 stop:4506 length:1233 start_codon:yes stop_codon:yes gene_type:complete